MRNEIIADLVGKYSPTTIFDVGANVGQSLIEFARAFPTARIHCFEPIPASFELLQQCASDYPMAAAHSSALSSARVEVAMRAHGTSTGNRIMSQADAGARSHTITTVTGDEVARSLGIERIDILKIDTEGHDLDVVMGFDEMIGAKRIEFIQVECGFAPENDRHIRFERFVEYFFPRGYRLHGIFGQKRRISNTDTRQLMFGDAVFVSMP